MSRFFLRELRKPENILLLRSLTERIVTFSIFQKRSTQLSDQQVINLTADETRDRSFVSVSHSFGSLQNTKQTKWTLNATQNHHSECFQVDSSFGSSQESTGCIDESLGCCDHVLVLVCTVMFDFSMTVVVFIFATTIALGRVTSLRGESR